LLLLLPESGSSIKYLFFIHVGSLIDTSGAMSGGGSEVRSGAMALTAANHSSSRNTSASSAIDRTITSADVQRLDEAVVTLQTELTAIRSTKVTAEADVKNATARLKAIQLEVCRTVNFFSHATEPAVLSSIYIFIYTFIYKYIFI
jgi:hypothetical protein